MKEKVLFYHDQPKTRQSKIMFSNFTYSNIILKILIIFGFGTNLIVLQNLNAQVNPLPEIINKCEKSIVPITGFNKNLKNENKHLGTGVFIGERNNPNEFILTCQHVIVTKDSNNKTLMTYDQLFANVNTMNGEVRQIPLEIVYTDEKNDFALLKLNYTGLKKLNDKGNKLDLLIIAFDNFLDSDILLVGDNVVYLGYPMGLGVEESNYPIARKGMVSQNNPNNSNFLIDGFVQGGSSGGPVFMYKNGEYRLCGLIQSYPKDFSQIFKNKDTIYQGFVIANPGLTNSKKINVISNVLISKFGFKRLVK